MPDLSPHPNPTKAAIRTGIFLASVLLLVTAYCCARARRGETSYSKRLGLYLEHASGLAIGSLVTTAGVALKSAGKHAGPVSLGDLLDRLPARPAAPAPTMGTISPH